MNSIARVLRPGWRWLLAIGLGVPLLLGLVLAVGVLISLLSNGYEPSDTLGAGRVSAFTVGAPRLFEEEDIWVVRMSEGEFAALYDRGLESGCPLQWRREFEFMSRRGWFVDACTGSAYDLTGRCFSDPCRSALLDRFAVTVESDNVTVELRRSERALPADANATPVNPPVE
jgi:nitrite reductase/ring-hydroxylating ferredoxin subunit